MISTPAAWAFLTVQCGSGSVRGTPGANTRAAKRLQSASRRSSTVKPAAVAAARLASVSSAQTTVAPPAVIPRAAASPERASPNTATGRPANVVTGVMAAVYRESALCVGLATTRRPSRSSDLRVDQLHDAGHVEVAEAVGTVDGESGGRGGAERRRCRRHLRRGLRQPQILQHQLGHEARLEAV